ncbi:PHP domain-containing protein [Alteromonas pelagimontana]|uniref:PHP domain-containing protein n=1 Tax=Alteromonas pelagimontana TaxID=1858656 RepID=A0A6M4MHN3_9ALTE|nr:PHP domain-containing protein [Alteromonas pelagimontana]QJR82704.1 PHP domain-containing protein [Alteromonas pelagimontana]
MKIDLHSHTRYSDGHLTPQELILRAHNMQVDVLAITDHDTVAALDEAHACQAQQKRPMVIIDGIEISTMWQGFDIHIVGLNVNRTLPAFCEKLDQQAAIRFERAQTIAGKLERCGFDGVMEKAMALAGLGQVTRAHFARVLVNNYGVASMDAAFKKYLGKGKRAHVKAQWPDMASAISWIHLAGGQAVLAHPAHYDMTTKWLRRLVAEFAEAKGDGIETSFPGISADKQQIINHLALEHKLLASAGSDFHFPSRWTELGKNQFISEDLTPIWHNWSITQLRN